MRIFFNDCSDIGLDGFNSSNGISGRYKDGGGIGGYEDGSGFVSRFVDTKRHQFVIEKQIDIFNTGLF